MRSLRRPLFALAVFFVLGKFVYADSINYTVLKMKNELGLTEEQAGAVKKIFQQRAAKQKELLQGPDGEEITDADKINRVIKQLDEQQAKALSQVLDADQMRKWTQKQTLKDRLNKDKIDYSDALGGQNINPSGLNIPY